jgi:MoxR-like ATPase
MALITLCYRADRPVLLIGRHGVGKSESLRAAAKKLNIGFITRDLSVMEPPDLVGLPTLAGGVTRYCPPDFLPTGGNGLLVFEELNRCPSYMRAPTLQLLSDRSLNDYRLPAGWLPVAAINPDDHEYEVEGLDPALRSRFVQVAVEADQQEWLAWARDEGIHPAVLAYVAADPEVFASPESNPRSWTYVSSLLQAAATVNPSPETLLAAIAGLVGETRAHAFISTLHGRVCPLAASDILKAYASHRREVRAWIADGNLDLARASLLAVLKALQAKQNYELVKTTTATWANLKKFLGDLPGDLQAEADCFFVDRRYTSPVTSGRHR